MRLLRQPRLALLFAGSALNAIGSWATLIALWGFAAYRFHASPGQVALLGLAWSIPGAVLSPLAGAPIDRFGPRVVMIASNILGVATALMMAASSTYTALVGLAVLPLHLRPKEGDAGRAPSAASYWTGGGWPAP